MPQPDDVRAHQPLSHLSFHVLLAMVEGELHGYAIVRAVEQLSGGVLTPGTGTFYSAIHRLQAEGLLAPADPPASADRQDSRRRYYRITELGERVLAAETERLEALLPRARALGAEAAK